MPMPQPVRPLHQQPGVPIAPLPVPILPAEISNQGTAQQESDNQRAQADGMAEDIFGTIAGYISRQYRNFTGCPEKSKLTRLAAGR